MRSISTDLTGTTSLPTGTLSDYQVVNNSISKYKVIQITGISGSAATRFLFQDISSSWTNRTVGIDIVQVEYDFFTGSGVTTSKNTFRTYIYTNDGVNLTAVAGFFYDPATLKLSGWAYYDNAGSVCYYTFNLITGGLTLTADTCYRIGVANNFNTGYCKCFKYIFIN